MIHITLYQPEFDPDAEYCDEIPRAGNTVFVLDTMGAELRKVPIGVEIVLDGPGSRSTVLTIPPAVYVRGVVDAQLNLTEGGRYLARVSITRVHSNIPTVYSFPIRVRAWYRALVMPLLMLLGLLALVAVSVVRYRWSGRLLALALCIAASSTGCNPSPTRASAALPPVRLIDDHGNSVSLDSLKGKVVLLDFVHIGCPGVCDNLINKFGQVADTIRPELGSHVVLVTISNDPAHDRPALLLKLAQDRQADMGGWLFLTGTDEDVARVTDAFGVDNRRMPDGSPNHITRVFLLGPDLRQQHEYAGMAMNSHEVATEIMNQVQRGGA